MSEPYNFGQLWTPQDLTLLDDDFLYGNRHYKKNSL